MATPDGQFIGRTDAMKWLRRHVLGWGVEHPGASIALLHGEEGAGKTTLIERFLEEDGGEGDSLVAGTFFLRAPVRPPSLGYFAQMLLQSTSTVIPELRERRHLLQMRLRPSAVAGDRDPASDTYTIHGSARDGGQAMSPAVGEEVEIAEDCVRALTDWLGRGKILSGMGLDSPFRLIFIFDGFDTYPTPVKSWLGRHFYPALQREEGVPRLSFLLTGRQSWEVGGQADYWEAHPGAFSQHYVGPLSRVECEEWLKAEGLRMSLVDILYEETEGNPARIVHALKDKAGLEKRKDQPGNPGDPLSFFTAKERRWLHAAAMIRAVNLEMLQVLLGKMEGTQAFGWLAGHIEFCQVERDFNGNNLLALSDELRKTILGRAHAKLPVRHREFQGKLGLLTDIQTRVRSSRHRENLRLLTPIQPIYQELVKEVFKDYA